MANFYQRLQDAGARIAARLFWLLFERRKPMDEKYVEHFLMPHYDRMVAAGISPTRAHEIVKQAIANASFPSPLPGMLLRDMADREIESLKNDPRN